MAEKAFTVKIYGIVQGVGFRPFVYKKALSCGIRGWVGNTGEGVTIHAEGEGQQIEDFLVRLKNDLPPLAQIHHLEGQDAAWQGYEDFQIRASDEKGRKEVLISPDVAVCADCLREMAMTEDRRYEYPFINCTNCGPRYTIIRQRPYDRRTTTMDAFPMCERCRAEYDEPLDRRFHAQPVACPICGPRVVLLDSEGRSVGGLSEARTYLVQGKILAVKGLGGFHLVCMATDEKVVARLRALKERGQKPFALMASGLEAAGKIVFISDKEKELLLGSAAPIVLLRAKEEPEVPLAPLVAPNLLTLGVMLPYTPLHQLLFKDASYDVLVMTSANVSGEPLIYKNEEALAGLKDMADFFLLHDREIYHPCDDSVMQVVAGEGAFLRRARGYVPLPVKMPLSAPIPLAAVGGEMKNAFCMAQGEWAFMSQYIGDMHEYANFERFRQEFASFQYVTGVIPQMIVHDEHPAYMTTGWAKTRPQARCAVQHHEAHLAAVQGEYALAGPVGGFVCDGTGYGLDGKIWGFEFLRGDYGDWQRVGHLEYLPLPGGDHGARFPARIAYAYCQKLLTPGSWESLFPREALGDMAEQVLRRQLASGVNVFDTSSAGRLFDAVSGWLGVCLEVSYEGQAAIELESLAWKWYKSQKFESQECLNFWRQEGLDYLLSGEEKAGDLCYFAYENDGMATVFKAGPFWQRLLEYLLQGREKGEIAFLFHVSLAVAFCRGACLLNAGDSRLLVSGGVFQNKLLTELLFSLAKQVGLTVYYPRLLPAGDGGLAYGQALVAAGRV